MGHAGGESVEFLGSVEADGKNVIIDCVFEGFVAHGAGFLVIGVADLASYATA